MEHFCRDETPAHRTFEPFTLNSIDANQVIITELTSAQNPRLKNAARLRTRRGRNKQRRIIVDGLREIYMAIQSGLEIAEVFLCVDQIDPDDLELLQTTIDEHQIETYSMNASLFDKIAFGDRVEGIVAVAAQPNRRLCDLKIPAARPFSSSPSDVSPPSIPESPLIVVIEAIEKPGNVGAVCRTADAAGADALIVADGQTDLFNPNVIRASLGTVFSVPVVEATVAETIRWLKDRNISILAARVDGEVSYSKVDMTCPCAIVLGSEADGLSDVWAGTHVDSISLPMHGTVDSLNISNTAAILLYEARRQRDTL